MLLSTAYFPPVSYFALLARDFFLSGDRVEPSVVFLEACEHYQKQSWRNRCLICTEGGAQPLRVPIVHDGGGRPLPIREVRVDWSTPWLLRSERAIDSAYHTSAYFDHYRDELYAVLEARPERLFDLNLSLIRFFLDKTGIACDLRLTETFEPEGGTDDYRERIHPKRPDTVLRDLALEKPYFQVFAQKYGFLSNLSVMDLLFNEGPDAILWLKRP